ncbi:transcriptional regulator LsrR [Aggregatibacter actinomycetemcomitans]|uniref:transcriptional regulator LsrR n=1 Tax=Aggregatibacter actinomycetemcomitans TaxID=714 RepID=UPI0011D38C43|nr:transcriptional regulator LsrR [Aggregatibacter actinomycetemcomitans]QEH45618.1 transcriptional regulator LsrR [Aggregatibacter actinomycetemcomitans]QEH47650.1 transcriptional regulator LsrR [Aggregatibacter actinomycetemcomitans]TYA48434.1 transcriptional regulator LsrR [Aggregatibacter actinomycetemcomitans]
MNELMTDNQETIQSFGEEELLARIAWFYYHDNLTQSEIGDKLKLPRLKVSRLLEKGRQSGIIKVQINSRFTGCLELEEALQQHFRLKHIRILPTLEQHEINERLGIGAAQMLMSLLKPNQMLAIGFGDTIMKTLKYANEFITHNAIKLITLSGGVGPYMKGIGQLDGSCSVSIIPAPLRASSIEAAKLFKREACVRDIMLAACSANAAIVGIGATRQKGQATLLRSGYITEEKQQIIRNQGAVGDILGYFMRKDGSLQPDMPLHEELISVSLENLKKIPHVIGVAGGEDKVEAILSALQGNHINSLVTEENTARMMLAQLV